jgi:hypothetical protein
VRNVSQERLADITLFEQKENARLEAIEIGLGSYFHGIVEDGSVRDPHSEEVSPKSNGSPSRSIARAERAVRICLESIKRFDELVVACVR